MNNKILMQIRLNLLYFSSIFTKSKVYKYNNFLDKSQYWSKKNLKYFQDKRLRRLIKHAYSTVPYYRDLFDSLNLKPYDIKTQEDLYKLPILNKEDIRINFPKKLVSKIFKKNSFLIHSSGSTGEPLQYLINREAYEMNFSTKLRGWSWSGWHFGENYAKISNHPRKGFTKRLYDFIFGCLYIYDDGLDNRKCAEIIKSIQKSKVKMIYGYPSTLSVLADFMEKTQISINSVRVINTHGEMLLPSMKKIIEKKFNCPVFDGYSGEGGANASQYAHNKPYLLSDEYAITEFIEDKKLSSSSEKKYNVVSTDLWNYAVPFIRYNIKDLAMPAKSPNAGKWLNSLKNIEGRDTDILITPNNRRLIVHFFTILFENMKGVDQYQIVQSSLKEIEVKIVVNSNFSVNHEKILIQKIGDYAGSDVNILINKVKEIPLTKSGKRRFVIRDYNAN